MIKVLTAGGVYVMYFFGGDFNKDDVGKFMGSPEPVGKDVTGMRLRIGVSYGSAETLKLRCDSLVSHRYFCERPFIYWRYCFCDVSFEASCLPAFMAAGIEGSACCSFILLTLICDRS
jgi:hypothetical protein